ncbi:amino acid permease [Rhodococcus hoagii]|nr:amino acid permease [Prescottella equi]
MNSPAATRRALAKGAIGTAGIVFMVVAGAAPLTSMASTIPLSLAFGAGSGTIGLILVALALLGLYAVGYVAISRHVVNAGAAYAFVGYGLGRTAGAAVAMVLVVTYNLAAAAMAAIAGYFSDQLVSTYAGVDLPWWIYTATILAVVAILGYRGIADAKKVSATISCIGFSIMVLLGACVFARNPGIALVDAIPIDQPAEAVTLSIVFIVLSFAGFEATAVYGEETTVNRSVGKATYISLAILGVVYLFSTMSLVAAFTDVQAVAAEDPGALLLLAAGENIGSWAVPVISAATVLSFLAGAIAFHNNAVRYMFSLGRSGYLPEVLSRTSRKGIPSVSVTCQLLVMVAAIAPFAVADMDPLTQMTPAIAGVNTLAFISSLALLSLSVLVSSLRGRLGDASLFVGIIAPALAIAGFLVISYEILTNYTYLAGSDSVVVRLMPCVPLVAAIYAVVVSRKQARERPLHEGESSSVPVPEAVGTPGETQSAASAPVKSAASASVNLEKPVD